MKTPKIFKKCQNNGLFRHLFVIIFTGNLHVEKESRNICHSFSRNLDNFVAYSLSLKMHCTIRSKSFWSRIRVFTHKQCLFTNVYLFRGKVPTYFFNNPYFYNKNIITTKPNLRKKKIAGFTHSGEITVVITTVSRWNR